jgi:prepilin-type N-terminal cleavage/methylation domain-containing protein
MNWYRVKKSSFTLIELLVAVSIFATIATVLYSCFRAGAVSFGRVSAEGIFQQKARYLLDTMTRDFKNMVYISGMPLEGTQEKISFISIVGESEDPRDDAVAVSYYIGQDSKEQNPEGEASASLIRKKEPLMEAMRLREQGELNEEESLPRTAVKKRTIEQKILKDASSIKFTYLKAEKEKDASIEIEYEWIDAWSEKEGLPVGVKVELTLTDPKSQAQTTLSRRVWIPQASPLVKKQLQVATDQKI